MKNRCTMLMIEDIQMGGNVVTNNLKLMLLVSFLKVTLHECNNCWTPTRLEIQTEFQISIQSIFFLNTKFPIHIL